jgi:murein DD-endopeptidase MepM/ murein hydrolase activator NlpD
MNMFSGGTGAVLGGLSYIADYEDIDDASILYTELEVDLLIAIQNTPATHPGYDEYRFSIDNIDHNPFELMAFLTAVYQDFTFAEVESTIREIFAAQYNLELTPVVEIRTRTETRTGSWTDEDGNSHSYTYTVVVEYEWHILYVTLTSRPLSEVLAERMDDDQAQHYAVLMYSFGARQFVGNPFDFDWMPFVSSLYGYRIHPISGVKQFHWGIDIGLPTGTPIRAGVDGTVVYVGYHPNGYGNFVVIESEDGIQARYAHCHEVFVTVGQTVERGDIIATVGNTGASTGPHLHMEIAVNGRRINPIFFVEFRD